MLTAIVLTHNNESTIGALLQSLKFCDETVVIDDDSWDLTREIAKRLHATVYRRSVDDDFASQRNFGLSKVKYGWAFFVDSDEIVTKDLAQEIRERISQAGETGKGMVGFFMKREDIFLGKRLRYGETKNIRFLRLAKVPGGIWIRPVHEYWDGKGPTGTLVHPLIHHSHENVAQFISDINRYSTINAKHFYETGVRSTVLSIILYPMAKFLRNYIFRAGFMDGTPGCIFAICMSFHSFLTRGKLYLMQRNAKA